MQNLLASGFHIANEEFSLDLIPERLRGEIAPFEIKKGGKVIVEKGRRITVRHIQLLEKAGTDEFRAISKRIK